jgi:hypothetical protein
MAKKEDSLSQSNNNNNSSSNSGGYIDTGDTGIGGNLTGGITNFSTGNVRVQSDTVTSSNSFSSYGKKFVVGAAKGNYITENFQYFEKYLPGLKKIQLVKNLSESRVNSQGVLITPMADWLEKMDF